MYVEGNPKTKKALRALVDGGEAMGGCPRIFSPGPFPAKSDGVEYVEGPHYPEPHRWYAKVRVANGEIVQVLS